MALNPRSWNARVTVAPATRSFMLDDQPIAEATVESESGAYISSLMRAYGLPWDAVIGEMDAAEQWLREHPAANYVRPNIFFRRWLSRRAAERPRQPAVRTPRLTTETV